jgi:hypothetical protein
MSRRGFGRGGGFGRLCFCFNVRFIPLVLRKSIEVARFCAVTVGTSSVMTLGLASSGLIEVAASLLAAGPRNRVRAAIHAGGVLIRCSFQEPSCI